MESPADAARFQQLSRRQRECLRLTYQRRVTKEIAAELGLSIGTVSTYCTEAIRILGARNRVDAAEQLHAWEAAQPGEPEEAPEPAPSIVEPPFEGVPKAASPARLTVAPSDGAEWARLLPLRRRGKGNDLSVVHRILLIFGLAVALAIGFGAVASGLRVVGDLVLAFRR